MCLVSIVTINLNNLDGLKRTVSSVRAQSFRDYEHIIVDGNSVDGAAEYLRAIGDKRTRVVCESDKGVFDAMNKGLRLNRGKYIYFLNSGDFFSDETSLSRVARYLVGERAASIVCGKVMIFDRGVDNGFAQLHPWLPHQGVFIRSSIHKRFPFDDRQKIFGDLDLWIRLGKANLYQPHLIEEVVACMEMDGLGSHPRFLKSRMLDKWRLHLKHGNHVRLVVDTVSLGTGWLSYLVGGMWLYVQHRRLLSLARRTHTGVSAAIKRIGQGGASS